MCELFFILVVIGACTQTYDDIKAWLSKHAEQEAKRKADLDGTLSPKNRSNDTKKE